MGYAAFEGEHRKSSKSFVNVMRSKISQMTENQKRNGSFKSNIKAVGRERKISFELVESQSSVKGLESNYNSRSQKLLND